MSKMYEQYFLHEDRLLDYFQVGRMMDVICAENDEMKTIIDKYPVNNSNLETLREHSNDAYDEDLWK